ncbi:unnamed protein product [Oncorhynchus mykiss]|uniref:CUB domain-containing protein n=1 Tax=Oncorhynchus mykiss TaxID=8022 RepID=A0A060WYY5_ONCMY|nr:unnamed protein product [Oncorhynchus mykiss]
MTCNSSFWAHVFMTAYLLWVTGCVAQKVYFDCGAKVDVVDVQGLILSPGFPYNYSSGTHCVWQFFVPVGHQLILEIFDFDVFESHDPSAQYTAISNLKVEDAEADDGATFPSGAKAPQSSFQHDKVKQVVVQEQSTKMEIAKVSNSAKRSTSDIASPHPPSHLLPRDQAAVNSITSPLLRGDPDLNPTANPRAAAPDLASVSSETQVVDACPHDVLYISDLLTFSSRFCGSNRPSSSQLVFGSSQEMVEVIMELITTTHWGRGFALLFHYHNRTEPDGDDPRHAYAPAGASKMGSLLAAMSGAAFFAMVLTSTLCIIFRPKLCPKRASSCSSNNSEVQEGVQNSGADVRELQLVAPNQPSLEVPRTAENDNNHSLSLTHTGSPVSVGGDMSEHAEVDLSSNGLTELDLGTDEVFIISSAPSTSSRLLFSAHTQRERFLRHSDTGPGPVSDWPSPDLAASPTETRAAQDGCARPRPRAWSVRTFQDFLPPLPQLHKKWCSWNSTSPFTKLVDSAPSGFVSECRGDDSRKVFSDPQLEAQDDSKASDSSMSNVSYPLTLPAQRQRRLNSTSNMRRSRFTGPCFGLLSGSNPSDSTKAPGGSLLQASPSQPSNSTSGQGQPEEVQGGKRRDFPAESDHVSVPVFAICEEEDRQPLILTEHLGHSSMLNGLSRGVYEAKGPAGGSLNPVPQSAANGPLLQRGRSEWRPWGSQASGGASPYPLPHPSGSHTATNTNESAFVHSTANQIQMPSLSQLTVPCSVTGNVTSDSPASSPCDSRADRQSMQSWVGPAKQ